MAGSTSNLVTGSGGAQVYNPATGTWSSYVPPPATNGVGSTAPNYVNSPISPTTGFSAANPINTATPSAGVITKTSTPQQTAITNAQLPSGYTTDPYNSASMISPTGVVSPIPTAPASGVVSSNINSGTGNQVLASNTTNTTTGAINGSTGAAGGATGATYSTTNPITEPSALNTQGNVSSTDPTQTPAYQQAYSGYQTAINNYNQLKQQLAAFQGAAETGDEALPVALGQEGALQHQLSSQLDAYAAQAAQYQAAMQTAVTGYTAQANATNQTTTQTQPSQQTTQVPLATTVLGPGNTPIVTTPGVTTPGSAEYTPTPTTYGTNGSPNSVQGTSATGQYTVKEGDTLYGLAQQYGTTVQDIVNANPGVSVNAQGVGNITTGQTLTIPGQGGSSGGVGNNSTLIGSPYQAGVISGQQQAGINVQAMKGSLASAIGIHNQITTLIQENPTLNSNPVAVANALSQYINTGVVPTGPYTELIQDLTDYGAVVATSLGYGGQTTDSKTVLSQSLVPTLAAGGTLESALSNLEATVQGKITAQAGVGQNPNAPIAPANTNINVGGNAGSTSSSTYTPNATQPVGFY